MNIFVDFFFFFYKCFLCRLIWSGGEQHHCIFKEYLLAENGIEAVWILNIFTDEWFLCMPIWSGGEQHHCIFKEYLLAENDMGGSGGGGCCCGLHVCKFFQCCRECKLSRSDLFYAHTWQFQSHNKSFHCRYVSMISPLLLVDHHETHVVDGI